MPRRLWFVGVMVGITLGLLGVGCAGSGKKEAAEPTDAELEKMRVLAGYRSEAFQAVREKTIEEWEEWTAGDPFDREMFFRDHSGLYSLDTLNLLEEVIVLAGEQFPVDRQKLDYFRRHILREMVERRLADLNEDIAGYESVAVVEIDGATVPFRQVSALLAEEGNFNRRRQIASASTRVIHDLSSHYEVKDTEVALLAERLGYGSYIALASDVRHVNLDRLALQCEQFLEESEALYQRVFPTMVARLTNVPPASFARPDMARLFVNPQYEIFFPAEDQLSVSYTTLLEMGLNLKYQDNLTIDSGARPEKNPLPWAFPVQVPSDIRLSTAPLGGVRGYESLLHQMARSQFYVFSKNPNWEFSVLDGVDLINGYGLLMASLVSEPLWLETYTGMPPELRREYVETSAFLNLLLLRRRCGKILYELELHRGPESAARDAYRRHMSRAYGFPLTEEDAARYRVDADDLFAGADVIRSQWFAAGLGEVLRGKYGERWFASAEAGHDLKGLWALGTQPRPEDVLEKLDGSFGPSAWLRNAARQLETVGRADQTP